MKNKKPAFLLALIICTVFVSGCFSNMVDKSFTGYTAQNGQPIYAQREVLGHVLLPFAFVGDVATAPIQGLVLMFDGDSSLNDPLELEQPSEG